MASTSTIGSSEEAQLAQTIEMFEIITQSQPQDYQSLEILKEAYSKLGREREVVNTSKRIAQAYVQMGQLSSAILEYETILQRFPDDSDVQAALRQIENKANSISSQPELAEPAEAVPPPKRGAAPAADIAAESIADLSAGIWPDTAPKTSRPIAPKPAPEVAARTLPGIQAKPPASITATRVSPDLAARTSPGLAAKPPASPTARVSPDLAARPLPGLAARTPPEVAVRTPPEMPAKPLPGLAAKPPPESPAKAAPESGTKFTRKVAAKTPPAEIEDGRKAMYKIFVEGRIITSGDFDLCWNTPDMLSPPNGVIEPFLQTLADKGILNTDKSLKVLTDKTRIAFLPLDKYDIDLDLARGFPAATCQRWCVLPFDRMSKSILVATANPFNQQAAKELAEATGNRLLWYLVPPLDLVKNLRKAFR